MTRFAGSSPAGVVLKCVVTAAAVVLAAYLVWGLRSLIVPASVGGLLAYICRPLVVALRRGGLPRLAVGCCCSCSRPRGCHREQLPRCHPSETGLSTRACALYALDHRPTRR